MAGSFEQRLGNIEELLIIIIIIIHGGLPGRPPPSDSVTTDTARVEALRRILNPGIIPDPGPVDLARLSLEAIESRLLAVSGELTRLKSHEAELNARLKELRGSKTK